MKLTNASQSPKMFWVMIMLGLFILSLSSVSATLGNYKQNLYNYWNFDENTGTLAKNSIIGSPNITLTASTLWTNGKLGTAVNTTGATGVAMNAVDFTGSPGVTVNFWVYRNGSMGSNGLYYDSNNANPTVNGEWRIITTGTNFGADSHDSAGTPGGYPANPVLNQWTMITIKINNTAIDVYQNGTYIQSYAQNNFVFGNFNDGIFQRTGGGQIVNAKFDEIGIWNRSLTSAEISTLWNNGAGYTYANFTDSITISPLNVYPANNFGTASNPILTSNATIVNGNLSNATLNVWYSNGTLFYQNTTTVGGTANQTNFTISSIGLNSYLWNVEWCGTNGTGSICTSSSSNNTFTWGYGINSVTYNATTTSSSIENYILNATFGSGVNGNAYFVWNNTNYTATKQIIGSNTIFTSTVSIPSVSAPTIKSFYWVIGLTGSGTAINVSSVSYNQTINPSYPLGVGASCPVGFNASLYFDFATEANLTAVNATNVYYNIQYGIANTTSIVTSGNLSNIPSFSICINGTSSSYTVGYGEIQYSTTGFLNRRFYVFSTTRLTNETINNTLYNLETGSATSFLIQVKDASILPLSNYYVALLRWYPNLNQYKVVEMGKTDEQGETVVRVKTEDVDYRIGVYQQDGTLVKLINPIRMLCLTSPCTYTILVTESDDYTNFQKVQTNLSFNDALKIFTFIWNDPTQTTTAMNLTVYKLTGLSEGAICSTTATGFTGILTCNVSAYSGTLKAVAYRSASPPLQIANLIEDIRTSIQDISGGASLGLFFSVILFIFIALIGAFASPILAIILGVIALVPALALGSINLAIFIGIAVLGGIVYHIAKRS